MRVAKGLNMLGSNNWSTSWGRCCTEWIALFFTQILWANNPHIQIFKESQEFSTGFNKAEPPMPGIVALLVDICSGK